MVKSQVFLFIGDDKYQKEKAIQLLSSELLGNSSKELDHKVFYGADSDAREILDYINTIPFLADKRFVVIKDFEKMPQEFKSRLIEYIKKPLKSTCLVLESKDDSILKEYGLITRYANVRRFGELTGHELDSWIKKFLAGLGKKIEPDAILILKELQGRNLLGLTQELEKLASFTGKKEEIKAEDVEEVVGKSLVLSTFDLADAIGEKRLDRAMKLGYGLILAGKKEYEIIGLLCWHFKRILRAKSLQARGQRDNAIAGMLKVSRKYSDGFFKQVESLGVPQLRSKIRVLLEADLDIKRTKYDPTLILEFAIIRLCL